MLRSIALRKINGAEVKSILFLLNKNILTFFLIGFVIGIPVAYVIVNVWLAGFAFHTAIHWWVFLLTGIVVFLITLATTSWQSYRAATTNPVESLKSE